MYILITEPRYCDLDQGHFQQQEFAKLDDAILAAGEVQLDYRDWYIFVGQRFLDEDVLVIHKQVEDRAHELRVIQAAESAERKQNKEIAEYKRLREKYGDTV
jgi:hypothetical protein